MLNNEILIESISEKSIERIIYIENLLFWEGKLSRKDLTDYFNISIPQATKDIKSYVDIASQNIKYDNSAKYYVPAENFKPLFIKPESEAYLNALAASEISNQENTEMFEFGYRPPFYQLPNVKRNTTLGVLKEILSCINDKCSADITYTSFSNPLPTERRLAPMALGFDGKRWHMRAFSYKDGLFKDYTLSRITSINTMEASDIDFSKDYLWHTNVNFLICPNPLLPSSIRELIESDFGMTNGFLSLEVKAAFIFYVRQEYCFDEDHTKRDPDKQHLILKNSEEINTIEKLLIKMTKKAVSDIN